MSPKKIKEAVATAPSISQPEEEEKEEIKASDADQAVFDMAPDSASPATAPPEEAPPSGRVSMLRAPTAVNNDGGNVRVFCRFRPLNERELNTTGNELCVNFKNNKTCSITGINKATGQVEPIDYTFDATFDPTVM